MKKFVAVGLLILGSVSALAAYVPTPYLTTQGGTGSTSQNASVVMATDASSPPKIVSTSVSTTTLGYLDATSSIQTQINSKAPTASPTFTGTISGASFEMISAGEGDSYLTGYGGPYILNGRRAGGTVGTPTAATAGQGEALLYGWGYHTAGTPGWNSNGSIGIFSAETQTDTNAGSYIAFSATPTGSTTLAEHFRVDGTGASATGTLSATSTVSGSNLTTGGHGSADIQAPGSPSEGALLRYTSSAWGVLAVGTNGQCLTSNGTDPVWGSCATGAMSSVGSLDGGTPSANGASTSAGVLYMQSASASNAGLVNTTTQTMAGNKTFSGDVTVQGYIDGRWTVVDGGNAPYAIAATDKHVRSGTTLTAARAYTLPACVSGNIGEWHQIKNLPAQTFNITLTGNGTDTIDGSNTFSVLPGDSYTVVCAVAGAWDIN